MSVEITLYTKKATKTGLIKFLTKNNFIKSRHFIDEMNTPDMVHFAWFNFEDYESSSGVEATIHKSTPEDQEKYKCSDWILHTRTRSSGSYEDKKQQNDIIKKARQKFEGTFYNDWYGTNVYINLEHYERFSPLEKGIAVIAANSLQKLSRINSCLNGYRNEIFENLSRIPLENMKRLLITRDPSIVLYNSLMPFLVSVIEYFFGQCFANYIKYDDQARNQLVEEKIKVGISDVLDILQKKNSLE